MLSSDPEHHPIEAGILPLVFALRCLRVYEPCWSCEGHDGGVPKLPRVWFYCRSLAYLKLLSELLADLRRTKALTSHWQVRLTFSTGDAPDPAFAIEPDLEPSAVPALRALQTDVRTIARELENGIKARARSQLGALRRGQTAVS
jgi:hypothetical protein